MTQSVDNGPSRQPKPMFAAALAIMAWYASNITVLLTNRAILAGPGFRHPVFLTLCHMLACAGLGILLSFSGLTTIQRIGSVPQLQKIFVLAVIFCATILLGNASLRYIPISFNQAIGATTPFCTAVFALVLQGKRETLWTYAALIPVVGGVILASKGEPQFHSIGFLCCALATVGRALKSVVQTLLLTDKSEQMNSMSLLFHMATMSVALLVPTTLMLEPQAFHNAYALSVKDGRFLLWLCSNSTMAYAVNLCNFIITVYTSALTLQVLGNVKGVAAAVISCMIFRNPVTVMGTLGYAITMGGVALYSVAQRLSQEAKSAVETKCDLGTPLLKHPSASIV